MWRIATDVHVPQLGSRATNLVRDGAEARRRVIPFAEESGATSRAAGASRSLRSSDTRARAGVRFVDPRGAARRHTREGDVEDIRSTARVEDVVHLARPLAERVPAAVGDAPALATDRAVKRGCALLDDDDRAPRVGVPAGRAARLN